MHVCMHSCIPNNWLWKYVCAVCVRRIFGVKMLVLWRWCPCPQLTLSCWHFSHQAKAALPFPWFSNVETPLDVLMCFQSLRGMLCCMSTSVVLFSVLRLAIIHRLIVVTFFLRLPESEQLRIQVLIFVFARFTVRCHALDLPSLPLTTAPAHTAAASTLPCLLTSTVKFAIKHSAPSYGEGIGWCGALPGKNTGKQTYMRGRSPVCVEYFRARLNTWRVGIGIGAHICSARMCKYGTSTPKCVF